MTGGFFMFVYGGFMFFVILDNCGRYWSGKAWHYCNKDVAKFYQSNRGAKVAMKRIAIIAVFI